MKHLLYVLMVFIVSFSLVACGAEQPENGDGQQGSGTEQDGEQQTEDGEDLSLYEAILEEGELRIGTEGTYPPFTYRDRETGELTGFDVEIAREVAERLGVTATFNETQWDAMFAGLDAERFDMVANQVGIRPDREEKYSFSNPYITSSAVLVTHVENDHVQGFEDIEGLTSAQSMTSNFADIAKAYGADIESVEGFNQAVELLVTKRVDVTINDRLSVLDFLNEREDAPVHIVAREEEASQSGLMFRQNGTEELVEAVNQALEDMMEDGTYLEISEKWFGEDVSQ
ncbi:amino acid ABC transporter substrate-binding protein [Caldalkalibacillus salinus]|uniref:amino acid ABC transporter substrate-binding protein n=1 Tax=Caldalkalibacillus salinus TaxID=2803787 RepID=UPI0019234969|nr:amino acid ABC transporter substrate-binding protein [Caldalkalibacillus salinus]